MHSALEVMHCSSVCNRETPILMLPGTITLMLPDVHSCCQMLWPECDADLSLAGAHDHGADNQTVQAVRGDGHARHPANAAG